MIALSSLEKITPKVFTRLIKNQRQKNADKVRVRAKAYRDNNKDKMRAKNAEWKKSNPDKVNAERRRYRQKNREKIREKSKEYNKRPEVREAQAIHHKRYKEERPEHYRQKRLESRERHRDKINERNRMQMAERYKSDPEYRKRVLEYASEYGKKWRSENLDKTRVYTIARRARIRGADGSHTPADIRAINKRQGFKCTYCETSTVDEYHVDHKTPLVRGGSNWPDNLQILCPTCNVSKWSRTHDEYLEWRASLVPANDNKAP